MKTQPMPTYPRNSRGGHDVVCPSCKGTKIESTCMNVTPQHDPNRKLCMDCQYSWRQEYA